MNLTVYVCGKQVLSILWHRRPAEPVLTEELPAEPALEVRPDAGPFGFAGGTFGIQERAWLPEADRPIDTD